MYVCMYVSYAEGKAFKLAGAFELLSICLKCPEARVVLQKIALQNKFWNMGGIDAIFDPLTPR